MNLTRGTCSSRSKRTVLPVSSRCGQWCVGVCSRSQALIHAQDTQCIGKSLTPESEKPEKSCCSLTVSHTQPAFSLCKGQGLSVSETEHNMPRAEWQLTHGSSWILESIGSSVLVWPSPGCCGHLGSKPMDRNSPCVSVSCSFFLFQIN